MNMRDDDSQRLSLQALQTQLHSIQERAFAIFNQAAERAEQRPDQADAIYLQAEGEARPLLAQGDALRKELIQRARQRARRAWSMALLVGAVALALMFWALWR